MGSETYSHAAGVFRSDNAGDRAALEDLHEPLPVESGLSEHVPVAANSNKQNGVIRLGNRRDAVAPVWSAITLIADEVTLWRQKGPGKSDRGLCCTQSRYLRARLAFTNSNRNTA